MAFSLDKIGDQRRAVHAVLTAKGEPYELQEIEALGRRVKAFVNAPLILRDVFVQGRCDLPHVVYEDQQLSFEETWQRACTLAHVLVEQYDIGKGDRVAISMRNYPEWIISFMAITSIGAVAVAMNSLWQASELDYALRLSGARVLIGGEEQLRRLDSIEASHEEVRVIAVRVDKLQQSGWSKMEAILAAPLRDSMPPIDIHPDENAIMTFTSGSTGHPKGAVSTHRNVISALLSWELDAETLVHLDLAERPAEDAPQSSILLSVPLFHVLGLHSVMLMCFRAKRKLILMRRWNADEATRIIERDRVTMFSGPPTTSGDLLEAAKRTGADLTSLVLVGGGGASRAPDQVRAIGTAFGNARPSTGWGMTETNAIGAGNAGDIYLANPGSAGLCSPVLELRVVDERGKVLGSNERGELQVRGTSVILGYWNNPEANSEAFDGDWFRTGDVAYLDDQGFLYIVDRIKDLVIRGGENIGCGAVEAALCEHPDVIEACVYGVPDERMGEEVAATIYVRAAVDDGELRGFLSEHLAGFQIPRYCDQTTEPLPRIATGKIFKRELRAEATKRLGLAQ